MEEKKRTIVMFGDSLTDYFPMEKLKDIDAQFINSGVAGDTIAENGSKMVAEWRYGKFSFYMGDVP